MPCWLGSLDGRAVTAGNGCRPFASPEPHHDPATPLPHLRRHVGDAPPGGVKLPGQRLEEYAPRERRAEAVMTRGVVPLPAEPRKTAKHGAADGEPVAAVLRSPPATSRTPPTRSTIPPSSQTPRATSTPVASRLSSAVIVGMARPFAFGWSGVASRLARSGG